MAKDKIKDIDNVPGEGDVPITIDGEELVLRPTLQAALGISRLHNDIQLTGRQIMNMDLDTIISVVAFGLGVKVTQKLQEQVWRTGQFDIRLPLMQFMNVINNGGRPPKQVEDDEEDDSDENPTETDQAL